LTILLELKGKTTRHCIGLRITKAQKSGLFFREEAGGKKTEKYRRLENS